MYTQTGIIQKTNLYPLREPKNGYIHEFFFLYRGKEKGFGCYYVTYCLWLFVYFLNVFSEQLNGPKQG